MTIDNQLEQIISLALGELRRFLLDLQKEYSGSDKSRIPPKEMFIIRNDSLRDTFKFNPKEDRGKWQITTDQIKELPLENEHPPTGEIKGIYFECGFGYFSISDDRQTLWLGWQVGPRFGRGYKYGIEIGANDELKLTEAKLTWIS